MKRLTEEDIVKRGESRGRSAVRLLLFGVSTLLPLTLALTLVRLFHFPFWLAFLTGFAAGRISGVLCLWCLEK